MRTIIFTILLALGLSIMASPVLAQSNIDIMMGEQAVPKDTGGYEKHSIKELERMIERAEFLVVLNQSARTIDYGRGCGKHIDKAKDLRRQLLRLKQQYRGKADQIYWKKDQAIRADYTKAKNEYETCFNGQVGTFEALLQNNIYNLQAHKAATAEHMGGLDKGLNIPKYIDQLKAALEVRQGKVSQNGIVATLTSTFKTVEYKPANAGGRGWLPATRGLKLRIGDEIRTGPAGRARIIFENHPANASPAITNIGTNSQIKMEKFPLTFEEPDPESVIELMRGAVRAFTKDWGFRASFSIRSGTSIVGIRGTEVAVKYNPYNGVTEAHLDHGDAYVEVAGVQTPLQPRTSVTVTNNTLSAPRPLTDSIWGNIVDGTGEQHNETELTASAGGAINPTNQSSLTPKIINYEFPSQQNTAENTDVIADELAQIAALAMIGLAEGRVDNYIRGLKTYNQDLLLSNTVGELRGFLEKEFATKTVRESMKTYVQVKSYSHLCGVCWIDPETSLQHCTIETKMDKVNGKSETILFMIRGGKPFSYTDLKIDKMRLSKAEYQTKFFERKPICY